MRSSTVRAGLAQRARIVLLAARGAAERGDRAAGRDGAADGDRTGGTGTRPAGSAALDDLDRSGRPPVIDEAEVVVATLTAAAGIAGGDALVGRLLAEAAGDLLRVGGPDLAGVEAAAVAARDVQVLHRPASWTPRSATWSGCT